MIKIRLSEPQLWIRAIILLGVLFSSAPISACDVVVFDLAQFSRKCMALSDQVRDVEVSIRSGSSDVASVSRLLMRDWLSLFLSHGQYPPPVLERLMGKKWLNTTFFVARGIGALSRGETVRDGLESLRISLELMGDPVTLFAVQDHLASWTQSLANATATSEIAFEAAFEEFLGKPLRKLGMLLRRSVEFRVAREVFLKSALEELARLKERGEPWFGRMLELGKNEMARIAPMLFWQSN